MTKMIEVTKKLTVTVTYENDRLVENEEFIKLFQWYKKEAESWIGSKVSNVEIRKDIVQELLIKLPRLLVLYDPERGCLNTLAHKSWRNFYKDMFKSHKKRNRLNLFSEQDRLDEAIAFFIAYKKMANFRLEV